MTPVEKIVERGRLAQQKYEGHTQAQVNLVVEAVAWAILEPKRNQELAELAVADTGLGDVADKLLRPAACSGEKNMPGILPPSLR